MDVYNATVSGLDLNIFEKVLRETDVEEFEISTQRIEEILDQALFQSEFSVETLEIPFAVDLGAIRARNIIVDKQNTVLRNQIEYNFLSHDFSLETQMTFKPGRRDEIAGAEPQITIIYANEDGNLSRSIGATLLEGYIALRAYEASQRRIETLEARVLEKQRMLRALAYLGERDRFIERELLKRIEARERIETHERLRGNNASRLYKLEADRIQRERQTRLQLEEKAAKQKAKETCQADG